METYDGSAGFSVCGAVAADCSAVVEQADKASPPVATALRLKNCRRVKSLRTSLGITVTLTIGSWDSGLAWQAVPEGGNDLSSASCRAFPERRDVRSSSCDSIGEVGRLRARVRMRWRAYAFPWVNDAAHGSPVRTNLLANCNCHGMLPLHRARQAPHPRRPSRHRRGEKRSSPAHLRALPMAARHEGR